MRRIRQITWIVIVWTTAAGVLAATTPHVVCRCARNQDHDRQVALPTFTCCCGACCQPFESSPDVPDAADNREAPCCHSRTHEDSSDEPIQAGIHPEGLRLTTPTCKTELVQADVAALVSHAKDAGPIVIHFLLVAEVTVEPMLPLERQAWIVANIPPPTDLVTTLQRLLI